MKKLLALLLSFIFLLASCQNAESDTIKITFWHYYHGVQQTALDNLITEYNETEGLEKGIIVEAVSYGGVDDLSNAVFSSANGALPDLFNSYSDSAYTLALLGKLADLDNYFTSEELNRYIDDYISEGRFFGGALYGFPTAKATEVFMLNKTDWDKFEEEVNKNPDFGNVSLDMLASWEGILSASEIYYEWTDSKTEAPNDGKALFGLDYAANFFYAGAAQLGYEFFDSSDGSIQFDKDILKKLWDTYYVPMVKGYFGAYGRFRSDDVKTGEILCFTGSTSSAAYFPLQVVHDGGDSYDIEAYVSVYPTFSGGKKAAALQGAGICVAKSDSAHEKAAAEFLKWFTEPERNLDFNIDAAGYFPVTDEAMSKLEDVTEEMLSDDKVLTEVYRNSIKQIQEYRLYSAPATEASAGLRADFDALKTRALEEKAKLAEISGGAEAYEAALDAATGTGAFEEWVKTIGGS